MKISELIKGLTYELKNNGDLDVELDIDESMRKDKIYFKCEMGEDESLLTLQNFPY